MNKIAPNRRILIVGEGHETEYNYFVGFRTAHEEILQQMATRVEVTRGSGGDARKIVKNAMQKASNFNPNSKRGDRVFLLLDAEGPGNSPGKGRTPELPAAEKLANENGIEIIYSCPTFEYWFLCHFAKASRGQFADCAAVIAALNKKWRAVSKAEYDKADIDVYTRLARFLNTAREQALQIDLHHIQTSHSARRVNPSTQVYELIAILIGARSGEKCPLTGTWKLLGDPKITVELSKGGTIPQHDGNPAKWYL